MNYLEDDAIISDCGKYRYLLRRTWDHSKPRALIVMLNPSTADAKKDDPTIRSCVRLCSNSIFGSFEVVNLYAYRATDPADLLEEDDPIGPKNDTMIEAALYRCDLPICAWGANEVAAKRSKAVYDILQDRRPAVFCFEKTKQGHPKHLLYIRSSASLQLLHRPSLA